MRFQGCTGTACSEGSVKSRLFAETKKIVLGESVNRDLLFKLETCVDDLLLEGFQWRADMPLKPLLAFPAHIRLAVKVDQDQLATSTHIPFTFIMDPQYWESPTL